MRQDVGDVSRVQIDSPEQFERQLGTFKRKVQEEGIIRELKRRESFTPPSEERREKQRRARARVRRVRLPKDPKTAPAAGARKPAGPAAA